MRVPRPLVRAACAVVFVLLTGFPAPAQLNTDGLFREPLHLSREVVDSISGEAVRLEEYCFGDRVISVRGERTSIADYRTSTLTEINRADGTYSVTPFEAIARVSGDAATSRGRAAWKQSEIEIVEAAPRSIAERTGRAFTAQWRESAGSRSVDVVVDRELLLTRGAVEVIVGAHYPSQPSAETDAILVAAGRAGETFRTNASTEARYALPLEHVSTWQLDGEVVRLENRVVRVGRELPPLDAVAIPPDARRVESPVILRGRMLDELDRIPGASLGDQRRQ